MKLDFPVQKIRSQQGHDLICQLLKPEYEIYLKLIDQALNLTPEEKQKSLEYSREKCPQLDLKLPTR